MTKNILLCCVSDGTERQNFCMVPGNMMKELISGKKLWNIFFQSPTFFYVIFQ